MQSDIIVTDFVLHAVLLCVQVKDRNRPDHHLDEQEVIKCNFLSVVSGGDPRLGKLQREPET